MKSCFEKEKEEKRRLWEECQKKMASDPKHDYTHLSDYINNTCFM